MNRKDMFFQQHLDKVRRALVKSGYLTGEEDQDELKNLLPDAAANLFTDLLHLISEADGQMTSDLSYGIWKAANRKYEEDGFTFSG